MRAQVFFWSICLLATTSSWAQDKFQVPTWVDNYESDNTEFAWWASFSDPYTNWQLPNPGETVSDIPSGEGNEPTEIESNNTDALVIQNSSSSAIISGTNGIYDSSGEITHYLIHDAPNYSGTVGTVLFQLRSWGSHADVESAKLYYRESDTGVLQEAILPSGSGFLLDGTDTYTAWEWNLTGLTVYDYYIVFTTADSSMSLKEAQLDTIDIYSQQLGSSLTIETNSIFSTIGAVDHHLSGESDPSLSYYNGDNIELTAEAYSGFVFAGWFGDLTGTDNPSSLVFAEGATVQAAFSVTNYNSWAYNEINPYIGSYSSRLDSEADPDNNGLINLLEYALGGSPENAMDEEPVRPQVAVNEDHLEITFRRQPAATDIEYIIMVSSDLVTWYDNADGSGGTYTELLADSISLNEDGTETVTVRDLTPIPAGGTRYIKIEVNES